MTLPASLRRAAPAACAAVVAAISCGKPQPLPLAQRAYAHPESGYRFVIPPYWKVLRGEVRSPSGILFTIQVLSLEDGEEAWVSALPRSVVPQLEQWARYFFRVVDKPSEEPATLGGEPALHLVYPVRIRPVDPRMRVAYWVARHGANLYVLRASYPADTSADDERAVADFLASWQFTAPSGAPEQGPPGTFTLTVPPRPFGAPR